MAIIKIDNGFKTYEIADSDGNVRGTISFNPSDLNIYSRAVRLQNNITEYLESIKDVPSEEMIEKMDELDSKIKQEIDNLFVEGTSEVVFGNQNCLNFINGETFVEKFLEAFLPVIKSDIEKETKKSQQRVSKYTSKASKVK